MSKYILTPTGRKLLTESDGKNTFDVGDEGYGPHGFGVVTGIKPGPNPHFLFQYTHIASDQTPGDLDFQKPVKVSTLLPITTRKEMLPFKGNLVPIKK
jgi:hypothetical protein